MAIVDLSTSLAGGRRMEVFRVYLFWGKFNSIYRQGPAQISIFREFGTLFGL